MSMIYDAATGKEKRYKKTSKDIANDKALKRVSKFYSVLNDILDKFCSIDKVDEEAKTQKPVKTIASPFSKKDLYYINKKIRIANSNIADIISIEKQYKKEDLFQNSTKVIILNCKQCLDNYALVKQLIDDYNRIVTKQYGSHAAILAEFLYPYDAA